MHAKPTTSDLVMPRTMSRIQSLCWPVRIILWPRWVTSKGQVVTTARAGEENLCDTMLRPELVCCERHGCILKTESREDLKFGGHVRGGGGGGGGGGAGLPLFL